VAIHTYIHHCCCSYCMELWVHLDSYSWIEKWHQRGFCVTIMADTQRLCFRYSPYFFLGLTEVNYKVDTVYLYKYKLILIASFHVCFVCAGNNSFCFSMFNSIGWERWMRLFKYPQTAFVQQKDTAAFQTIHIFIDVTWLQWLNITVWALHNAMVQR